jgi:hypothetical protein
VLDADDTMVIEPGGTFEARLTSDFGPGDDLFRNEGIVHALKHDGEQPTFIDLERFENKGAIWMVDGDVDDVFLITSCVCDLVFVASGRSTLAVDAFLGPPGSTADNFIVEAMSAARRRLSCTTPVRAAARSTRKASRWCSSTVM